jgi:hypothetical protein
MRVGGFLALQTQGLMHIYTGAILLYKYTVYINLDVDLSVYNKYINYIYYIYYIIYILLHRRMLELN